MTSKRARVISKTENNELPPSANEVAQSLELLMLASRKQLPQLLSLLLKSVPRAIHAQLLVDAVKAKVIVPGATLSRFQRCSTTTLDAIFAFLPRAQLA